MNNNDHADIERELGYRFYSSDLLEEALRHSSFVNEQPDLNLRDNERFEFLGDAVLSLVVGHILMQRYPDLKEGDLSRMRANLVNESQLARIARSIHLGKFVRLGKGEIQTNGRKKKSILANTFEAIIAAVYLDGGFKAAYHLIDANFSSLLEGKSARADHHDYKSKLQEMVQERQGAMPKYSIIREEGPDHEKTFWIELVVFDIETQGAGKSKKIAEQEAARKALEILNEESR